MSLAAWPSATSSADCMLVPRAKTSMPPAAKTAEAAEAAGRTTAFSSAQAAAQAARMEAANVSVMLDGAATAGGGDVDERALSSLAHSKVHPRMLHSAATSHSWPFAAIAELVDNAQDAECDATSVWVEGQVDGFYQNHGFVKVEDDGRGLTRDAMVRMMSYGFSNKEHAAGNVGRYGVGFKSGSMRLGQDALVCTKSVEGTATVALLSRTFLDEKQVDEIMIPMFTWAIQPVHALGDPVEFERLQPAEAAEWQRNLQIMAQYSPMHDEAALLGMLRSLQGSTGTGIWCYNLRTPTEFTTEVPHDLRIVVGQGDDKAGDDKAGRGQGGNFKLARDNQNDSADVPEDYSLREYLSVLYLRPRVKIFLQRSRVLHRCPIARLDKDVHTFPPYTPRLPATTPGERPVSHAPVKVTLGYSTTTGKLYGVHIYNKNRLIKMYKRFGKQLQANCMWKTLLGVVEADCLTPSHSKQEFDESQQIWFKVKTHIGSTMKTYYDDIQTSFTAGLRGAKKANRAKPKETERNMRARADARADAADRAEAAGEGASGEETEAFPDSSDDEIRRSRSAVNHGEAGKGDKGGKGGAARKKSRWVAAVPGEFTKEAADEAVEDNTWWGVCGLLLRSLRTKRGYAFFEEPVDPVALRCPDYFDIVTKPMSFSVVQSRLEACRFSAAAAATNSAAAEADDADRQTKRQRTLASLSTAGPAGVAPYTSPTEFATDMVQVFQNAVIYNMPGHEVHVRAKELYEAFIGRWKHAASRQPLDALPECAALQLRLHTGGAANDGGAGPSSARATIDEQDGNGAEDVTASGGEAFRMRDVALARAAPPSTCMADTSTNVELARKEQALTQLLGVHRDLETEARRLAKEARMALAEQRALLTADGAMELYEAFIGRWKHAASRQPLDALPECAALQLRLHTGGAANDGGAGPSSARATIDEQDGNGAEDVTASGGEAFRMRDVALARAAPPSTCMADTSTNGGGGALVPYVGALEMHNEAQDAASSAALVAKEAEVWALRDALKKERETNVELAHKEQELTQLLGVHRDLETEARRLAMEARTALAEQRALLTAERAMHAELARKHQELLGSSRADGQRLPRSCSGAAGGVKF